MATSNDANPWLTPEEQRAWLAVYGVANLLPTALDAQLQRDHGLTLFEYAVLSRLSDVPGRALQLKSLAALTNGSQSRLSHVITRLEKRGLVSRSVLPEDGRITQAELTDDGLAVVKAAAPDHVRTVRELVIDPLTATQVRQIASAAGRILAALGERADVPPADLPPVGRPASPTPRTSRR